jgi:outer membrane protein assembly factor BamB
VVQDDSGAKRTWYLVAVENGAELWRADAPGTLGAPVARGGLVYMPFLTQWLTILDGATGEQLARIRQTDEAISFVRATSDGIFYGGKGVFVLDEKSVKGTRSAATYGQAQLPKEFVRTVYHFDAFSPVQTAYSAFDRNRVLWRAKSEGGNLVFEDGLAVVFSFRFFFAFDAQSGALRWAHAHPRNDLASVEHAGDAIFYVSTEGEIGAIDARSGGKIFEKKLSAKRITGATFDADGLVPAGTPGETSTVAVLAAIVADKDTRFNAVKLFATSALGSLEGQGVGKALLAVVLDPSTPAPVYQKAGEALVARQDKDALPALLAALNVKNDFLAGTKPRALEVLARAVGALGAVEAVPALVAHLSDPATPMSAIKDLAEALGAIKSKEAIPALRAFLLTYRADPAFGGDNPALPAVVDALLVVGGGAEREVVQFVADDARTLAGLAEYARFALKQTGPDPKKPAPPPAPNK